MKARYVENKNLWNVPLENHYLNPWKSILKCREIGVNLIERKFKEGKKTSLWFDPWINGKSLINLLGWSNFYHFGGGNT